MKIKRIITAAVALLFSAVILCSCADSSEVSDKSYNQSASGVTGWIDKETVEIAEDSVAYPSSPMLPEESVTSDSPEADALSERKIIKNKDMSVETIDFDSFTTELSQKVSEYGGYVQDSTMSLNSYYESSLRSANYTLRIPADRFEEFTSLIGDMATVTYSYEYVDDVTSSYVDIEARLASLRAEQESFLKLMEQAQTVDEILQIQSYLTDVNYQIESFTAQLKSYDSLIAYSTLRLSVQEVKRISESVAQLGVFERIGQNLSENLSDIGNGFKNFFVGIVSSLPYLIIYGVVIAIIVVIIRAIIRKNKSGHEKNYPNKLPNNTKDSEKDDRGK